MGFGDGTYHKRWDGSDWLPRWEDLGTVSAAFTLLQELRRFNTFALGLDNDTWHYAPQEGSSWMLDNLLGYWPNPPPVDSLSKTRSTSLATTKTARSGRKSPKQTPGMYETKTTTESVRVVFPPCILAVTWWDDEEGCQVDRQAQVFGGGNGEGIPSGQASWSSLAVLLVVTCDVLASILGDTYDGIQSLQQHGGRLYILINLPTSRTRFKPTGDNFDGEGAIRDV